MLSSFDGDALLRYSAAACSIVKLYHCSAVPPFDNIVTQFHRDAVPRLAGCTVMQFHCGAVQLHLLFDCDILLLNDISNLMSFHCNAMQLLHCVPFPCDAALLSYRDVVPL